MPGLFDYQLAARRAGRDIHQAQGALDRGIERIASGQRVNSARDDAAGLAIAERLHVNLRADRLLSRSVLDGVSLVQTAEGGLARVAESLQRARELAVQAAHGTLGAPDRAALDREYQQLMAHIDQVAGGTQAFGVHLLAGIPLPGQLPGVADLFPAPGSTVHGMSSGVQPVGALPAGARNVRIDINSFGADDDLQIFTTSGRHLVGTPLSDVAWAGNGVSNPAAFNAQVLAGANGFAPGAAYDDSQLLDGRGAYVDGVAQPLVQFVSGMTLSYSGDGDHFDGTPNNGSVAGGQQRESFLVDEVTEPLVVMVVGSGVFDATASWDSMPPVQLDDGRRRGPVEVVLRGDFGSTPEVASIGQLPSDSAALGLHGTAITTAEGATGALGALDLAIDRVAGHRATLGATAGRFERVIDQLATEAETASGARSRILDSDMAEAMAAQLGARIRADAGHAMLAKANADPRAALELLLSGVRSGT